MPNLTAVLLKRGYKEADIRKIMGENLCECFVKSWGNEDVSEATMKTSWQSECLPEEKGYMNRRRFLIDAAVLTSGSLAVHPALAVATSAHRLGTLGIQVSAVHAELNKDFSGTLARVAALGYREIELVWWFGNFDRTPKQLRAALDGAGLSAPSGHISAGALWVGWERRLEQAHMLGHEYLFCTDFGADTQVSLDDWREWADRLNRSRKKNVLVTSPLP